MYLPITYSLLESIETCQPQLDLVEKHFGKIKPIPLTKEVAIKFSNIFDIPWAVKHLLTCVDMAEYSKVTDSAWDEYLKVTGDGRTVYQKAAAPALIEYEKVLAAKEYYKDNETISNGNNNGPTYNKAEYNKIKENAAAAYDKVTESAYIEYTKIQNMAWDEYSKAMALTFVEIYTKGMK